MVAPRLRSGRNRKKLRASVSVTVVDPWLGSYGGRSKLASGNSPDRIGGPRTDQVQAQLRGIVAIHRGKLDLQQNLSIGGRDVHVKQVDDLADGTGDRGRAVRR